MPYTHLMVYLAAPFITQRPCQHSVSASDEPNRLAWRPRRQCREWYQGATYTATDVEFPGPLSLSILSCSQYLILKVRGHTKSFYNLKDTSHLIIPSDIP